MKIVGEIKISFAGGIVKAFISNPNPAVLSFNIKGGPSSAKYTSKCSFLVT